MHVTFLGTGGARPTVERNPSAVLVDLDRERLLFDVGEGTQRQMIRYSTGIDVSAIFLSHLHGDHVLGLPGLLQTLNRNGRSAELSIYTPQGTEAAVRELTEISNPKLEFPVQITGVDGGDIVERSSYSVRTFETEHGTRSRGYGVVKHSTRMPGSEQRFVYTGDTRPTERTVFEAAGAELLVHDAMFTSDHADRARKTGHSTVSEATKIGQRATVERIALTHISSRYGDDISSLTNEAVNTFGAGAFIPHDGDQIELTDPE